MLINVRELKTFMKDARWPLVHLVRYGDWHISAYIALDYNPLTFLSSEYIWAIRYLKAVLFLSTYQAFSSLLITIKGTIANICQGYQDTNLASVKKAEQHLLRFDEVFIVARIDHAISNQSVQDHVHQCLQTDLEISRRITIVCTCSDARRSLST